MGRRRRAGEGHEETGTVWGVDVMVTSRVDKVARETVSVLGPDKGYTVKYNPLPEGVPEGEAQGNS